MTPMRAAHSINVPEELERLNRLLGMLLGEMMRMREGARDFQHFQRVYDIVCRRIHQLEWHR